MPYAKQNYVCVIPKISEARYIGHYRLIFILKPEVAYTLNWNGVRFQSL